MKKQITAIPESGYTISYQGVVYGRRGNPLKFHVNNKGYARVTLHNRKKYLISRLVGLTFIPNPNNYQFINHIDGNKLNNNASNIEWVSSSMNMKHAYENNLIIPLKGEQCSKHKLTENNVIRLRQLFNTGLITRHELALIFGVKKCTIDDIIRRRTWKHI